MRSDEAAGEDASASLLGYLYQIDAALALFIEEPQSEDDPALAVELFDDFSLSDHAGIRTLAQVKFKLNDSLNSFGDKSRDVWRTLEIWIRDFDPARSVKRVMFTNATAREGTAFSYLRPDDRDVRKAAARLTSAAQTGKNKKLTPAYRVWLELSPADKLALLNSVVLLERSGDFDGLNARLDRALAWSAPAHAPVTFRQRVIAIWHDVALGILLKRRGPMRQSELRAFISDLRDGFSHQNLPTTVSEDEIRAENDLERLVNAELYVDQMRWIESPPTLFEQAVVDYCRAVRQQADWLEDSILSYLDIEEYKGRLIKEWKELREWLLLDLNPDASDRAKIATGRALYKRIMLEMQARIRESYSEPFFMRGTYHFLANQVADGIGWHPEYEVLLESHLGQLSVAPNPQEVG